MDALALPKALGVAGAGTTIAEGGGIMTVAGPALLASGLTALESFSWDLRRPKAPPAMTTTAKTGIA